MIFLTSNVRNAPGVARESFVASRQRRCTCVLPMHEHGSRQRVLRVVCGCMAAGSVSSRWRQHLLTCNVPCMTAVPSCCGFAQKCPASCVYAVGFADLCRCARSTIRRLLLVVAHVSRRPLAHGGLPRSDPLCEYGGLRVLWTVPPPALRRSVGSV